MNTTDLNKYYEDTFSLVRTMVVKIEKIAKRDNLMLKQAGYHVSDDKRTWRYYLNLNGDYHETDEPMIIQSIDTGEDILFSKANLLIHTLTRREYTRGGYWYNRLQESHPSQANLINGIINPIPTSETINAQDYKILRYNRSLVLWNEDQLIPKLQDYINSISSTLFEHEYIKTDNLFLTLAVQQLYADIVKAVFAIRTEDVFTRHTHEFFIWSHINSFGNYTKYKYVLTREQTMWLFRNIAWITKNPGKQFTFDKLMYNLLTVANIPLAKYDLSENTETQVEDLTPTPMYRRQALNLLSDYGRSPTFETTDQLILKQRNIAKNNPNEAAIYLDQARSLGRYSLHSTAPTKVLESRMLDTTNKHNDTLMSVVLNEWVYLTGKGVFGGSVLVSDPKTGRQIRIGVADGYNLWSYLIQLSKGQDPLTICPAYYQRVLRYKPPSFEKLMDLAGSDFASPKIISDIRSMHFPVAQFMAPDYLIQYSSDVYWLIWEFKKLYSQYYDLNKRARLKNTTNAMLDSGIVTLGKFTNYDDLIQEYQLDLSEHGKEDLTSFAWEIFVRITGWDTNSQPSTGAKQEDLVNLMMELSSYTIHTLKKIEDGSSSIELPNETNVGDSKLVGFGNSQLSDFSNVQLNVPTNLDNLTKIRSFANLENFNSIKPTTDSSGFGKLVDNPVLKPVNVKSDIRTYALKFTNTGHITRINTQE